MQTANMQKENSALRRIRDAADRGALSHALLLTGSGARMETAKFAAENGFDAFTSTLFVSPYQNHELLKLTAEAVAEKYGVKFLYRDFRPFFKEGQEKARELQLYMQKYCGCVFSEEERYQKKKK